MERQHTYEHIKQIVALYIDEIDAIFNILIKKIN